MAGLEFNPTRLRYYLDGRPVQGGEVLELCVSGGWIVGRFEFNPATDEHPAFYFTVELERGQAQLSIPMPEGARLRWPSRG